MSLKFNPLIFSGFNETGSGGAASGVDSVNGQTGVVQINADDIPYDNTGTELSATDVQAAINEIYDDLASVGRVSIYVDADNGNDTTGTGSVIYPVQTINKAMELCSNDLKKYVIRLTPGDYNGPTVDWQRNVDLIGSGTSSNVQQTLSYVAEPGSETGFSFSFVTCNDIFLNFDTATSALPTFTDGSFKITRSDSQGTGPWATRINDSTIGEFDITGNNLLSNCLFVSTAVVRPGGQLYCNDCIIGIQLELEGSAILGVTGCVIPGILNGTTIGPDTPTVRTDASSLTGTTLNNVNISLSDSSTYVSYDNGTSGLSATTVKTAIDEIASNVVISVNGQQGVVTLDTSDIPEVTNLYFTDERAQDAVGTILLDSSNVTLTYSDATPSIISDLTDTTVTPGSFGDASTVSQFTVDQKGRITAASEVSISITSSSVTDFVEAAQDAVGASLIDTSTIDLVYNDGTNEISAAIIAGSITDTHISASAAIDASKLADGSVSNTEFQYLDGATSNIQQQLDDIVSDIAEPIDLTTDVTGVLPVANGGTGLDTSSIANGQILIGNGTGFTVNAISSDNGLTVTNGSGTIEISTVAIPSPGDLNQAQVNFLDNQTSPANISGLVFPTAAGFEAQVYISRASQGAKYTLDGAYINGVWAMSQEYVGISLGIMFSITNSGQIQYTSTSTGDAGTFDYRALTL